MKQKDIFLKNEADKWFYRNAEAVKERVLASEDSFITQFNRFSEDLPDANWKNAKVLEIGCSDGIRLEWMKNNLGAECYGIDPSKEAIQVASGRGVNAVVGTADKLPFENVFFDVVIFGFCLYLCDKEDLMLIASEADRVLKMPGWLFLWDFYSETPTSAPYKHYQGVNSTKMDYKTMFTWHPAYHTITHNIRTSVSKIVDDKSDWVSFSVLRKNYV